MSSIIFAIVIVICVFVPFVKGFYNRFYRDVTPTYLVGFLMNDYDCYLKNAMAPAKSNPDKTYVLVIDLKHKTTAKMDMELTISCSNKERISVMKKLGIG